MVITHKKLQPMQCYHIFSDTGDVYLSKNHYGSYSPQMVPVAEMSGSGSWPMTTFQDKLLNRHQQSIITYGQPFNRSDFAR